MKRILIVEVPEGGKLHELMYSEKRGKYPYQYSVGHYTKYTEFTPPTDEEINSDANGRELSPSAKEMWVKGATWFKSLLQ